MTLRLVEIQPGVVKDITDYSAGKSGPFYVDSNLVRFKNGFPQKLGGWQQESYFYSVAPSTSVLVQGTPKKSIFWRGFDSIDRIAIGTTTHLYLIKENISQVDESKAKEVITKISKDYQIKKGILMKSLRVAFFGCLSGPDLIQSWELLSENKSDILRIERCFASS